ncbi:MAG: MFS transporter, partial [Tatlockia sp.]|nr:MFS transporter [Tatlockia sp.]
MNTSITRLSAWGIWIIASLFYAYQYILRVMPNIMLDNFIQQFHIDTVVFGQFSGIYYLGYSLIHLPIGIMLDRFGPRKVMTACILLTVLGLMPLLFAEQWTYPLIGRLLIGMGSSAAILGTFKIIRIGFKEEYFARMLSFSVTIGLLGAIYGGGPVSYLCSIL